MPTALDLAGVLRVLRDEPDLVCLTGAWAGAATVVARAPTRAADHLPPGPADGWWLGVLPYDGPPRLTLHDHLLVLRDGQWSVVASGPVDEADELARRLAAPPPAARSFGSGPFGGADAARHLAAVEQAIGSIRAGELYQVNVCTRLSADFTGDPVEAFLALLALRPDRAAYVRAGDRHVLSASPEVFLRRVGRTVSTRPIKGTLPRRPGDDERLRRSVKDRAENVMIVDLLRNDLGRVCVTGSVRVPELCVVEPHAGVWQLVSAVEGELRADVDDAALLAATFPPGSVTGAPKHSAVAEIAALEATPRGVYTGAIGYAGADAAEWNVAIRTFEISGGRIELGVGGGITADSVPVREWHECLHKAAPLVAALGSSVAAAPEVRPRASHVAGGLLETLAVRGGRPVRVVEHLARLDRSARELYDRAVPADLVARVHAAAAGAGEGVVRVVLAPDGVAAVTASPPPSAAPPTAFRTVRRDGVWRHKWADRSQLSADEASGAPLYVAADGAVLETSRGNVFILLADGTLVTPPLRDDVLPGVTRRAVLDLARDTGGAVQLRTFPVDELCGSVAFWTSSLRGAVPIASVDGVLLPRCDDEVARVAARLFVS